MTTCEDELAFPLESLGMPAETDDSVLVRNSCGSGSLWISPLLVPRRCREVSAAGSWWPPGYGASAYLDSR